MRALSYFVRGTEDSYYPSFSARPAPRTARTQLWSRILRRYCTSETFPFTNVIF